MKEDMQKKLFCEIVLITFFVAECTFKLSKGPKKGFVVLKSIDIRPNF